MLSYDLPYVQRCFFIGVKLPDNSLWPYKIIDRRCEPSIILIGRDVLDNEFVFDAEDLMDPDTGVYCGDLNE